MLSKRSQSSELAGLVTSAVQKLQILDETLKERKLDDEKVDFKSSVKHVIQAVKELEAERLRLHELLETETIKASVLRYKLHYMPGDIRAEIQAAVSSARQSNEAEIKRLKDQLNNITKNIASLEKRQQDLDTENSKLQPVRDDMQTGHDEIIALLNQKMADKASKQITLNETRDKLRETYKRIIDLEDSIVQLKEDLIHEREEAALEKEKLRQSVADTQKKVEEQRTTNATVRKEIEKLQEELVDSESALDSRRKVIRKLETSRSKLEAIEVQLNRQLQKEIRDNSQLTQEGMKIVKEHNELSENLGGQKDELSEEVNEIFTKVDTLQEEETTLNTEKTMLTETLQDANKQKDKQSDLAREEERKLLRAKEALSQQNAECVRIKRENIDLEREVEQLKESHQATVDTFNKQIEDSRSSLNSERKDRQTLQSKRDNLTKESNELKSDYGKYMASMSKKVSEGKAEHGRLTNYGTQLQKDLKQDEIDIINKQKQLKKAKQDYTSLQKKLKSELKTLQESISRLEKDKTKKKEIIEDKTPVFKDLEKQFREATEAYEKTKKNIVDLKNKKASLETSVGRAEKDVEKMATPQTSLREQLRTTRTEALEQLKNQSKDVAEIEKDIFTSGQKLGAVLKENHRLKQAIKKLELQIKTTTWHIGANVATKDGLQKQLVHYREFLHQGWSNDLKLDEEYAKRDIKILDNIQLLQNETQTREERIERIHSQLEEQLMVLGHFMDGIASLRPKDTAQSENRKGRAGGDKEAGDASRKTPRTSREKSAKGDAETSPQENNKESGNS